jgi:hypothetical protein
MRQQSKEYLVILFIIGVLALNYPMLDMFDRPWMPFGVPLLYLYLYLVWFVLIVLLIVVVQHSEVGGADQAKAPPPEGASRSGPETVPTERRRSGDADPAELP